MGIEDKLYPLLRVYEKSPQWVKDWAGGMYRALPSSWRLGKNYRRFAEEAAASERWSRAEIDAYQLAALRESVAAAWKCAFYRERFQRAGLTEEPLDSVDQLRHFPTLRKADVIEAGARLRNPDYPDGKTLRITTGGSSGEPVPFYLERGVSRPKEQAYLEAMWSRAGYQSGDRLAVVRGHTAGTRVAWKDATRNWLLMSSYHLTDERMPQYWEALEAFQPDFLHAYPSSAVRMATYLEMRGMELTWRPKALLCGSERLAAWQRKLLERVFAAPVYAWYGHSERIVLAGQGRRSEEFYFWPGYGFVEFEEENEEGLREVIGTSFHNRAMPFIRYRTGDFVKLAATAGEFAWVTASEIAGREMEFLVAEDGRKASLTALNRHDDLYDGIRGVQFVQSRRGVVELRYVRASDAVNEGRIVNELEGILGPGFRLAIREVGRLEAAANGKQRWLVTKENL